MKRDFMIKKENLIKIVPTLIADNINFSICCTGIHTSSWGNGHSEFTIGDNSVEISLDMSGEKFHKMLVDICGKENVNSFKCR